MFWKGKKNCSDVHSRVEMIGAYLCAIQCKQFRYIDINMISSGGCRYDWHQYPQIFLNPAKGYLTLFNELSCSGVVSTCSVKAGTRALSI